MISMRLLSKGILTLEMILTVQNRGNPLRSQQMRPPPSERTYFSRITKQSYYFVRVRHSCAVRIGDRGKLAERLALIKRNDLVHAADVELFSIRRSDKVIALATRWYQPQARGAVTFINIGLLTLMPKAGGEPYERTAGHPEEGTRAYD